MKKNDWILGVSVLSYSFLFFEQFPGINFLLLNAILICALFIKDKQVWSKKGVRLPMIGALISSICIMLYGDGLSVFANIFSLTLLAANSMNAGNSVVTAALFGLFSYISGPLYLIADTIARVKKNQSERIAVSKPGVLFYLIPVLMVVLFFIFYRGSSKLFENLTDQIQLSFISIDLIFFTFGGFLLLYAFYHNRRIGLVVSLEAKQRDTIEQTGVATYSLFGMTVELPTERKSGMMMLSALNILILVVNILDIQFLILGSELPEGMTYSELVHQGIGSLILSIITAIGIILWYFKGEQNYTKDNMLKVLAYLWIAQNILMILTNGYKNYLYIEDSSLTYKRIGVFVYLLLATIGLITTLYKLNGKKSAWYLVKANAIAWYVVLLVFCPVNWDVFIVRYNIGQAIKRNTKLDVNYLASLSDKVIPDLYGWVKTSEDLVIKASMEKRMCSILRDELLVDWRSWCPDRIRIVQGIDELFKAGTVDDITMTMDCQVPYPQKITKLRIENRGFRGVLVSDLQPYHHLETLNMSGTSLSSLQGLPLFPHLRILDLDENQISILNPVTYCTGLVELSVANNRLQSLPDMSALQQLKRLDLSRNEIRNFSGITSLEHLEYLDICYTIPTDYTFLYKMVNLKTLVMNPIGDDELKKIKANLPGVTIKHP